MANQLQFGCRGKPGAPQDTALAKSPTCSGLQKQSTHSDNLNSSLKLFTNNSDLYKLTDTVKDHMLFQKIIVMLVCWALSLQLRYQ